MLRNAPKTLPFSNEAAPGGKPPGAANLMEAGGIEPPSRDDVSVGLYMFSRSFDLGPGDEDRHPSPAPRRQFLTSQPTPELRSQLAVFGQSVASIHPVPRPPKLGSHCERGSAETDAPVNITVIGS